MAKAEEQFRNLKAAVISALHEAKTTGADVVADAVTIHLLRKGCRIREGGGEVIATTYRKALECVAETAQELVECSNGTNNEDWGKCYDNLEMAVGQFLLQTTSQSDDLPSPVRVE